MCSINHFFVLSFSLFLLAAQIGCVSPQTNTSSAPRESLRSGYEVVYSPEIQPGTGFDSSKKDLEENLRHIVLYPDICPALPLYIDKTIVYDNRTEIAWTNHCGSTPKTGVFILDNFKLFNAKIVVEFRTAGHGNIRYEINFPDLATLEFDNLASAKKAADALLSIQHQEKKADSKRKSQLARFESTAAQYSVLKIKPPVAEEQRRFIVQANTLSQQKKYAKAIEQYLKVIDLNPTSYPPAYFNLALLSAQNNSPLSAIHYMKHYLLLVPNAPDARGGQDKIYEWELMMNQ